MVSILKPFYLMCERGRVRFLAEVYLSTVALTLKG